MKGIDLNTTRTSKLSEFSGTYEVNHVYRQTRFRPSDGTHANEGFSPLRADLQRKSQGQIFQLPGSIPLHGFCSNDLPGKPKRDRDLSSSAKQETLSYGNTWRHCSQHTVQCKQSTGLENLGRLCPGIDKDCQAIVCRRGAGARTRQHNLRTRFLHHRSVSICFPMGPV